MTHEKHDELRSEVLSAMVLYVLHQNPELARFFTENPDEPLDANRVLSTLQAHNQRTADALGLGRFAAAQPVQPTQRTNRDRERWLNVSALFNAAKG